MSCHNSFVVTIHVYTVIDSNNSKVSCKTTKENLQKKKRTPEWMSAGVLNRSLISRTNVRAVRYCKGTAFISTLQINLRFI